MILMIMLHDHIMISKRFLHDEPFVMGILQSVVPLTKGQ